MSAGRVLLGILGGLLLIAGLAFALGGGALVGLERAAANRGGFITSSTLSLERDGHAILAPARIEGHWPWSWGPPVEIRVVARAMEGDRSLFIGIADRQDVEAYLAGVPYEEVTRVRVHRVARVTTGAHPGTRAPSSPTDEAFWRASVQGEGEQALTWAIEPGDWALVLMNADAGKGVVFTGSVGARAPWILGVGIGLLVSGVFLLTLGIWCIAQVARRSRAIAGPPDSVEMPVRSGEAVPYPLSFAGEPTEPLGPWRWLFKWLLLVPHYVVLWFLWMGFAVSWCLSLLAILFTGRYPRGLFDYNVGVLRWTWRVGFYGYSALATDQYPPFRLRAGGHPADLDVPYPETLRRGLVLVKWWLLALPHYVVLGFFQGGAAFPCGGLVFLLALFAAIAVLFTGHYPKDLFDLVLGMNRWSYRVGIYAALMTDRYPPFRLGE